jgi:UDP-N-acetylmuramoyl-tripeptide--D-alanyl-D-alanine ligase
LHKPKIIAIAGSVNKSFAKEAIKAVLEKNNISVRANPNSFNTEIGLPLAILSLPSGYNSYKDWMPVIYKSLFKIFNTNFPSYLVLELGVAEKGDMKYLLSLISPEIAVITDITKRYLETFKNLPELLAEYEYLIKNIPANGLILVNQDNIISNKLLSTATAPIITYGIDAMSDWQAENIKQLADGQLADIVKQNKSKNYKICRFGRHHIYSLMVGLIIQEYIKKYERKEEKGL